MKVVYPVCCGIDVHKSFLIATIMTSKPQDLQLKQRTKAVKQATTLLIKKGLLPKDFSKKELVPSY